MRTKTENTWHGPHKQRLYKCYKVYEDYVKFDTEQAEKTKSAERQKTIFPKESVENTDLHKLVLKRIMTTHE